VKVRFFSCLLKEFFFSGGIVADNKRVSGLGDSNDDPNQFKPQLTPFSLRFMRGRAMRLKAVTKVTSASHCGMAGLTP